MATVRNPGRVAGLWYLSIIVLGPLRLMYIPAKLIDRNDATLTAANILAHETLFRLGMASDLLCALALIMLVMALYRLFESTSRPLAALIVIFGGVMPATLYLLNAALDATTLTVLREDFLLAFSQPQRNALALLLLRLHDHIVTSSLLLAGAWLFPIAILSWRSRVVPRFIAVWLFLAGGCWTLIAFTGFLDPPLRSRLFTLSQPFFFAEIAFTLWLVLRGSREDSVKSR